MTIATITIIAAMFIPLICTAYAKILSKSYDNRAPRDFLMKLDGKAKRAYNAQLNAYEAFPPFAIGVVIAQQMQAHQVTIDIIAVCFIAARVLYSLAYIYDHHILRSVLWFTGFGLTISLFFIAPQ